MLPRPLATQSPRRGAKCSHYDAPGREDDASTLPSGEMVFSTLPQALARTARLAVGAQTVGRVLPRQQFTYACPGGGLIERVAHLAASRRACGLWRRPSAAGRTAASRQDTAVYETPAGGSIVTVDVFPVGPQRRMYVCISGGRPGKNSSRFTSEALIQDILRGSPRKP